MAHCPGATAWLESSNRHPDHETDKQSVRKTHHTALTLWTIPGACIDIMSLRVLKVTDRGKACGHPTHSQLASTYATVTHTHRDRQTDTPIHTHTHTHTRARTHTHHTHTHRHKQTDTPIHTHAHTHPHTNARTHTHPHTRARATNTPWRTVHDNRTRPSCKPHTSNVLTLQRSIG